MCSPLRLALVEFHTCKAHVILYVIEMLFNMLQRQMTYLEVCHLLLQLGQLVLLGRHIVDDPVQVKVLQGVFKWPQTDSSRG